MRHRIFIIKVKALVFFLIKEDAGRIMLNRSEIRKVIEKTFTIHNFNLQEYQDKYYFQKRILENLPELTGTQIYQAIDKVNSDTIQLNQQEMINLLSDELYNYYLTKQDDTSS